MPKKQILIPHREDGSIPHYICNEEGCKYWVSRYTEIIEKTEDISLKEIYNERIKEYEITWKPAEEFEDTLQFIEYSRGRSSVFFLFKSLTNGSTYPIFVSDFSDMIVSTKILNGVVSGKWVAHKKGANFGIKYVKCSN